MHVRDLPQEAGQAEGRAGINDNQLKKKKDVETAIAIVKEALERKRAYSREYQRKWRQENPEKARERGRLSQKKWREKNPEKAKECQRRKYYANPEKYRQYQRDYRARKKAERVLLEQKEREKDGKR